MSHIGNPENLNIEDNVFIGHFNLIDAAHGLTIGAGTQITNHISILTHSSHVSLRLYGDEYVNQEDRTGYLTGSVTIGKFTFIGPHSTILPNTKIGKGSLVKAYSLVKGEFPDFAILSGRPAKVVGTTKDLDSEYLEGDEKLQSLHQAWSKD